MKQRMVLSMLLALVACGGEVSPSDAGMDAARPRDAGLDSSRPTDAGGELDAGSADDAGTDSGAATDSGTATDSGSDSGAASDGGSACTITIEDRLAGVCDGRGRTACTMWAQDNGGPGAVAQCTPPEGRCARADSCDSAGTCTCGAGPECGDSEMCVSGFAGFSCVCISP